MAISGNCLPTRILRRSPAPSLPSFVLLSSIVAAAVILSFSLHLAVENLASQTRTIIGHNLDPTPWHVFERAPHPARSPTTIFRCTYLSCSRLTSTSSSLSTPLKQRRPKKRRACPDYFSAIHRDLEPWRRSRISRAMVEEAQKRAAMRIVVSNGRMYVDLYYACTQSRAMFTIWGMLQLMRRYPGMVPDVDMMFDCMDRPSVGKEEFYGGDGQNATVSPPPLPPLFRYCTNKDHLDIPFPDWSFWGWAEVNIKPWEETFKSIKHGSKSKKWAKKDATAYWKGNSDVGSPIRTALLSCNDSNVWGAKIMHQNWGEEVTSGFQKSDLSKQCNHRYKIYAEGFAWSVSLKYILACGSLPLIIDPQYEDFFSRGLVPKVNYWPVSAEDLCPSIKAAVDWGNKHPSEAEAIGKKAQELMEELDMDRVYDYMYHLIVEYSKLQDFVPTPPSSAQEFCSDSILCLSDETQRKFLESSYASPASFVPCTLPSNQTTLQDSIRR